ncbi:unnamed protein product [Victoria cruziana]
MGFPRESSNLSGVVCSYFSKFLVPFLSLIVISFMLSDSTSGVADALAEWLRRVPAKYMGFPRESSNLSGVVCSYFSKFLVPFLSLIVISFMLSDSTVDVADALAEWLRRVPAKYMGFPRESSNLSGVVCSYFSKFLVPFLSLIVISFMLSDSTVGIFDALAEWLRRVPAKYMGFLSLIVISFMLSDSTVSVADALAEWLRRVPAKYMGFPRESSNLSGVVFCYFSKFLVPFFSLIVISFMLSDSTDDVADFLAEWLRRVPAKYMGFPRENSNLLVVVYISFSHFFRFHFLENILAA